jgi:CRISPR-associated endoribonuclease Cas6
MRILTTLTATRDMALDTTYHHKLRGCIWSALEGQGFETLHDDTRTSGFVFSNIFPWRGGEVSEGDECKVMVASPNEELLATVAAGWLDSETLNIGEMSFAVADVNDVYPDVGEPGTRGVLETATGVLAKHPGTDTYWKESDPLEPFNQYIEYQLQRQHDVFYPNEAGPYEVDERLFSNHEFIKTYSIPVEVAQGERHTLVLSKWRFPFMVRDEDHRRHLNLALDTGIGARNGVGLGYLNITEGGADRIGYEDEVGVPA